MKKDIVIIIDGKSYPASYTKNGNDFNVELNHSDFTGIIFSPFHFKVENGKAGGFLIGHPKTMSVMNQIITQISKNEISQN
jgi:hypothetical protein